MHLAVSLAGSEVVEGGTLVSVVNSLLGQNVVRNVLLGLDECKVFGQVLHCVLLAVELFVNQRVAVSVDAGEYSRVSHSSLARLLRGEFLLHLVTLHDAAIKLLAFVNLVSGLAGLALGEGA